MAEELIINVNVQGEEAIGNVDTKLNKVTETGKKTTNAFAQMRREMRDAKADMLSFAEGTNEYNAAMQRAAGAADKMRDMQDKIKASQKDVGVVAKNVAGSISGLAGAFSTMQGIMGLVGAESDNVTKAILKVTQVMQVTSGVAQMSDSLDNFKDLYNAVKLNVLAMVAAKQKETIVSVENTVANTAEAGAITSVGVASKVTGKALLAALGPYALIGAAIAGLAIGITNVIKKLNEVPEDVKVNIAVDEEVSTKMAAEYTKVIKFAYDYNREVKNGNKDRIKQLEEVGRKEFGLNKTRLKMIADNKEEWRNAFSEYLELATLTYKEESFIKKTAEAEVNRDILFNQQQSLKNKIYSQRETLVNTGARGEGLAQLIENNKMGQIGEVAITSFETDEAKKYAQLINQYKETNNSWKIAVDEALVTGANLRKFESENAKDLNKIRSKDVKDTSKTTSDKKVDYIQQIKDYKDYLNEINNATDNYEETSRLNTIRLNQTRSELWMGETEKLKSQRAVIESEAALAKARFITLDDEISRMQKVLQGTKDNYDIEVAKFNADLEKSGGVSTPDLEARKKKLEETLAGMGASEAQIASMIQNLGGLQTTFFDLNGALAENTKQTFDSMINDAQTYLGTISNVIGSISSIYQSNMDVSDNEADARANNIENMNISEEERTKLLAENEQRRYEEKKKAFEAQKKLEIASAWVAFAAGTVGVWSQSLKQLGPIAGPIVATAETAALLATTIAQTNTIASQQMEAPTKSSSSGASSSGSSSSAVAVALNPTQTSMTSKEENLNLMNQAGRNVPETVVRVVDINKVQNTVKVRENNASY